MSFSKLFTKNKLILISDFSNDTHLDIKNLDAQKTNLQSETFDYIIASNMIHHVPYPIKFFYEMHRILKKNGNVKLNENKSGVYVNLSFLPKDTISELEYYLNYIEDQETSLIILENQKEEFKNSFFIEKEVKDDMLCYSSISK